MEKEERNRSRTGTVSAAAMNIGNRLHDSAGTTLAERLDNAAAQGFSCVHLALSKTVPGLRMADTPSRLTESFAREVRQELDSHNLQCAVLGCYLNLATPDEDEYRNTLEIYRAHLRFAAWIHAGVTGTETGAPNRGYTTEPACFTQEALELFIRRVEPLVRYAEECGVPLAIEPVVRHIVSTPARAEKVLQTLPSPFLRIILDSVNLLTPETAAQADSVVEDALNRLGDRISVLHMKDWRIRPGASDLEACACGTGGMHYNALLRYALAHPGLPMTLENTTPENAEAARLHLESLAVAL